MLKIGKKPTAIIIVGIFLLLLFIGIMNMTKAKQSFATIQDYYQSKYRVIRAAGLAEYMQYDYPGLERRAHTIAVVTPLDDLTAENTFGISESGDRYYYIHSVRTVKVLQYFKNEKEYGDTIVMAEMCGSLEDGTLVMMEDCWPMQRGDTYLVFLCDSGFGYPLSVSACNGKYDLTHLNLNCEYHSCVLMNAMLDLGLLTEESVKKAGMELLEAVAAANAVYWPQDKEHIIKENAIEWQSFTLFTPWTNKNYPLILKSGSDEEGAIYNYLKTMQR